MKFSEYVYERPNIDEVSNEVIAIADEIAIAKSKDEAVALIQKAEKITNHFQTMSTICSIRNLEIVLIPKMNFIRKNKSFLMKIHQRIKMLLLSMRLRLLIHHYARNLKVFMVVNGLRF